jgi:transcription initiation factor TFIID subunit 13
VVYKSEYSPVQHFLFAHGDVPQSLDGTKKVLDELITDFITELCFEAHRSASLAGRQKIKLDDIRFACRKNPMYLGRIEDMLEKKKDIDLTRKIVNPDDDKLAKSAVKAMEEELNEDDDVVDGILIGKPGKSFGKGGQGAGPRR